MLTLLQMLPGLRGLKRCCQRSSSMVFARPSIQPKQSAWSTASDHVRLGLLVPFFRYRFSREATLAHRRR